MKTIKYLALAAICTVAINASAQQGRMRMTPEQTTDSIKHHVTGITADQEAKILVIEQDFSKVVKAARDENSDDRDAMRTKMQSLRQDRDTKIKAVLTADQYTQYTQMEKEHPMGGGRGKKGGSGN